MEKGDTKRPLRSHLHLKPPIIHCENQYPRPTLWPTGPSPQGQEQGGLDGPFKELLSPVQTFQAIYFERNPANANSPASLVVLLPSLLPVAQIFGQRVLLPFPPFLGPVIPLSEWHLPPRVPGLHSPSLHASGRTPSSAISAKMTLI